MSAASSSAGNKAILVTSTERTMLLSRICLLFGLAAVCEGKDWRGPARLSPSKPWVPLTSFAFDLGAGKVFYLSLVLSRLLPQLLVTLVSSDGRLEQCVTLSLLRMDPVSSDELHCCTQLERIGSTCISHALASNCCICRTNQCQCYFHRPRLPLCCSF